MREEKGERGTMTRFKLLSLKLFLRGKTCFLGQEINRSVAEKSITI